MHFTYVTLLNPLNNPIKEALSSFSFDQKRENKQINKERK